MEQNDELKDLLSKVIGTKNLLQDGKIIIAYNKLVGIQNKLYNIIKQNENNNSEKSEELQA